MGTDTCFILLLLICVFLAFLVMHCNKSSLKSVIWTRIARSMCDGRPFASSPFHRLAGRGPSFRGFPLRWALQFALSLARCLTIQAAAWRCWDDSLYECGRPHDTLSCLFFYRLHKTLPTKSVTCSQVVPMSLEWTVAPPRGFDQSSHSPSQEDPNDSTSTLEARRSSTT